MLNISRDDLTSPSALRAALGSVQARNLPDMIRLALAAADIDADAARGEFMVCARDNVNEAVGFDLHKSILELLDLIEGVAPGQMPEPEPTEVEYCRVCGDDHTIESDQRAMQGFCTARVHTDAGLVNWCALPLGHPEVHHFPDLCDSCAKPIREGIGGVRVPQTDGTTRVYHAECWDQEAGERA